MKSHLNQQICQNNRRHLRMLWKPANLYSFISTRTSKSFTRSGTCHHKRWLNGLSRLTNQMNPSKLGSPFMNLLYHLSHFTQLSILKYALFSSNNASKWKNCGQWRLRLEPALVMAVLTADNIHIHRSPPYHCLRGTSHRDFSASPRQRNGKKHTSTQIHEHQTMASTWDGRENVAHLTKYAVSGRGVGRGKSQWAVWIRWMSGKRTAKCQREK